MASVAGAVSVAGCMDQVDLVEETSEQLEEDAEDAVEDVTGDLERPPGADLEIDDGTITVMSLNSNTEGIKCGPIEGDDPLAEIEDHELAATAAGETIEDCDESTIVAVTENGNTEVIEQL
ncbi:hypothetical protein D8Y22_08560 [Salinadaptatus halalkaliphilus]|uniref:Uncharacterized protein n=2 Tax=Salinadaptatus halalkaliphilus TaxID=2419781 RepID=A0A4S3TM29_9EURY|nr:hypothetical protein D8Y22_08560 [Salinadaptatus halalkaliphilus]